MLKPIFFIPIFLLLFVLSAVSCTDDSDIPDAEETQFTHFHSITKTVSSEEIPHIMTYILDKNKGELSIKLMDDSGSDRSESDIIVATIETEGIVEVTDEDEVSNYSFMAAPVEPLNEISILNYVVSETDSGELYSYIVTYKPEGNWYAQQQEYLDMDTYTGEVLFYTFEGVWVSASTVLNGEVTTITTRDPCDPGSGGTGGGTGGGSTTTTTTTTTTGGTGGGAGGGTGGQGGATVICQCEGHHWGNPECTCQTWVITIIIQRFTDPTVIDMLRSPCGGGGTTTDPCTNSQENPCGNPTIGVSRPVVIDPINLSIEEKIISTNLDPCSTYVLNLLKVLNQTDIAAVLNRFGTPSTNYDWEVKTEIPPINPSNAAESDWKRDNMGNPIDFDYVTRINPTYKNQATRIAIARTILHELLHTYLNSLIDDYSINGGVKIAEFHLLFNAVVNQTYGSNPELWQHEAISRKFINPIRDALKEWDNAGESNQYYEDLAWGALYGTSAFNALFPRVL